ncbi:MAG: alanine racemase [Syntrophomonadaceae bacterium]|nr:alanine racemase [Syntrophomonadaceae bacterium]
MDNARPTWAEIDLKAIKNNLGIIKRWAGDSKVMAVVKADAYGHGMVPVAAACLQEGVDFLGVASLEEAIQLRNAGISIPILVLGYISEKYSEDIIRYQVRPTVFNYRLAQELSRSAVKLSREVDIHIKIDTGMGRLGFDSEDTLEVINRIALLPGIKMEGIFTHLATADCEDKSYSTEQLQRFSECISRLEKQGVHFPLKHCSNSAGLLTLTESRLNMIRAGIILYGLYPSPHIEKYNLGVVPAMKLKSRIVQLKTLKKGAAVSYGRSYICSRDTKVATVPIGYADGYSRLLSNRAWAVIKGERVPLIGKVCMDQCMFDVTGLDGISENDEVLLFGRLEDGVTADDLARIINTINYEIVCSVSSRVPRTYI